MNQDLEKLEEALMYLGRAMAKPKLWHEAQRLANVDIDRAAFFLLSALSETESGCKLHELAIKLGIEAPSVSRTVHNLEQNGLVERTIDDSDRRISHIGITAKGLTTLKYLRQAKRAYFENLLSDWSATDRHELINLLHRLATQAAASHDIKDNIKDN